MTGTEGILYTPTPYDYEFDLFVYWRNVEVMAGGRKTHRKARYLRKYRRMMDRDSYPCLFLKSRRLKERPILDYRWNHRRSLRKQITYR